MNFGGKVAKAPRDAANGKPSRNHGSRQVRFWICGQSDEQGFGHLYRGSELERRSLTGAALVEKF
jgi:hypothetical protein